MPGFFERLSGDIFKDVDLDEEFIRDAAEAWFLDFFGVSWDSARSKLT